MPKSALIDRDAAREALEWARPLLESAVGTTRFGESGALHVVILDPGVQPPARFDEAVLLEESFGEPARWDADYAGFARAKARVAWTTGRDSHAVATLAPHLLQHGDPLVWGSVCLDGIVVGVSGAQPWFDEALAGTLAMLLRAIAKERAARFGEPFL